MNKLFTFSLVPMALIGLGIITAFICALVRAGYDIGQDLLEWVRALYSSRRSHFDAKKESRQHRRL